jgi:hypothetical protein
MAAPDQLLKEWGRLGFSKVFTDWLRSLSGTQNDVDDVEDNITVINNQITTITNNITEIEGELDGGLGAAPSYVEPYANTQAPGVIEIATLAEVVAATDARRAVTPATLTGAAQFLGYFEPLTNGDTTTPELIFAGGDVVMIWKAA